VRPSTRSAGRTAADLLALWIDHNEASWSPATRRDQVSRAGLVKADPIARMGIARLAVADVDRWHARVRRAGVGEGSLRNRHLVGVLRRGQRARPAHGGEPPPPRQPGNDPASLGPRPATRRVRDGEPA